MKTPMEVITDLIEVQTARLANIQIINQTIHSGHYKGEDVLIATRLLESEQMAQDIIEHLSELAMMQTHLEDNAREIRQQVRGHDRRN